MKIVRRPRLRWTSFIFKLAEARAFTFDAFLFETCTGAWKFWNQLICEIDGDIYIQAFGDENVDAADSLRPEDERETPGSKHNFCI